VCSGGGGCNRRSSILVGLDISVAFDSLNHDVLINLINHLDAWRLWHVVQLN